MAVQEGKKYRKLIPQVKKQIVRAVGEAPWGKKGAVLAKFGVTAAHVLYWKRSLLAS